MDEIPFNENSTSSVAVYTATDPEGETIVWSLLDANLIDDDNAVLAAVADYPDYGDFSIVNGALSFKSAPNYEDPQDDDTDNEYNVMVLAIAGDEGDTTTAMQPVRVTVKNLDEPGSLTLSTDHPKVGVLITATLTDPDGWRGVAVHQCTGASNDPCGGADPTDFSTVTEVDNGTNINTSWRWATSSPDNIE